MRFPICLLFCLLVNAECCCTGNPISMTDETVSSKNFKNMTGLILESAVVSEIAQRIQTSQRIQLRNMKIPKITKNMMKNFSGIFSIDLRANEIAEIEDESFAENTKLEKIDLMLNRLTKITKKLFSGNFDDLQEINLSHNLLTAIEMGSFDKLLHLESIDLSCNCLRHVHADVFKKNPELQQVYLQSNDIEKISTDLFNSKTDLLVLDLSRNKLDFVPEFNMKQIKNFDVSFNSIPLLDLNYSHEKKKSAVVLELHLGNNQINECVELEERRTDIIHLDLTSNKITDLDDFPSFLNLEVLMLANNSITDLSLHNFEDRFPSLKVLNVRANPLSCGDYKYIRNNLQSIVFTADTSTVHKCHSNDSKSEAGDYEEYEDAVTSEIRTKNREILKHLKRNQLLLVALTSVFAAYFIITLVMRFTKRQKKKESLLDQMEM